nr:immunoglobulin light chain junction region [Macaca mulatta]MOW02338.1 immunoglobulin light chain junction region [Macaca mulatta]MOW02823.1 immunoglobulin light chain junction region [Macaca mulatta]MOW03412.1 immunoglobulin light chain junction region [Macaca mulatta]MOW03517.1 immunoglobulin light chain junction region [Macaca mulatta]
DYYCQVYDGSGDMLF